MAGLVAWLCFLGVLIVLYVVLRYRRLRAVRRTAELFKEYYRGAMPVERLSERVQEIADRRFTGGPTFYSVAVAAFQRAAGERLAAEGHSVKDESNLLKLWAAAQKEFGLTDRYRIEAWRPGRE